MLDLYEIYNIVNWIKWRYLVRKYFYILNIFSMKFIKGSKPSWWYMFPMRSTQCIACLDRSDANIHPNHQHAKINHPLLHFYPNTIKKNITIYMPYGSKKKFNLLYYLCQIHQRFIFFNLFSFFGLFHYK